MTLTTPLGTVEERDAAALATSRRRSPRPPARTGSPVGAIAVEVVVPVYNEERDLEPSVRKLRHSMGTRFDLPYRITIADNASVDSTPEVAARLARELPEVRVLRLERKGRGGALRAAWSASEADVVAYMDVDLSTDLAMLPALLEPLLAGRADIVVGSRLAPGAQVTRGIRRELISRAYNLLLHALLGTTFSDAQCGFKAARRELVLPLLARVQDDAWFFDTELLYLAQRARLSIHEVPVRWVDDPDSRVKVIATAREDLRGIARLRRAARRAPAAALPEPGAVPPEPVAALPEPVAVLPEPVAVLPEPVRVRARRLRIPPAPSRGSA